LVCNWSAVKLL